MLFRSGAKELHEQIVNLGMINLDQNSELLAGLNSAQALRVASVLIGEDTSQNRTIGHARKSMHPWKPRFATAVSALHIVAAASLLQGSKGEQEIHVYERQTTEVEIHEIIDSGKYGQGIGLALMMLGFIMIITAICALCVQARIRWRQVTSQGESLQAATEGALRAAPRASEAYHQQVPLRVR